MCEGLHLSHFFLGLGLTIVAGLTIRLVLSRILCGKWKLDIYDDYD